MDRKFANRIIKDISSELNLKKVKRLAYRLIGENGFYAMVGFTFEGSGYLKGGFYCWKFIQTLIRPDFPDPKTIICFNNGDRIGSLWTVDEFLLDKWNVINEFNDYLRDNATLDRIYRNAYSKVMVCKSIPDIYILQDALYLSVALEKYHDAQILAKKVIDIIDAEGRKYDWMQFIRSNAHRVSEYLKDDEFLELNDWLKSVQRQAMKDLKIPYPEE